MSVPSVGSVLSFVRAGPGDAVEFFNHFTGEESSRAVFGWAVVVVRVTTDSYDTEVQPIVRSAGSERLVAVREYLGCDGDTGWWAVDSQLVEG